MAIWRNDWEKATAGGRSWKTEKTGGFSSLLGDANSGGSGRVVTTGAQVHIREKTAEDEGVDDAPTEVSREDVGRGINFREFFDPKKADQPGAIPTVDPLLKLQKAHILLGKQVQQVLQGLQAMTQQVQGLAQQGQAAPNDIQALEGQIQAMAQQLGIQLPPGPQGGQAPAGPPQGGPPPQQAQQGPPQGEEKPPSAKEQEEAAAQQQAMEQQQAAEQSAVQHASQEVDPDGQVPQHSEMAGRALDFQDENPEDANTGVPEGLEFDPDDDDEAYANEPKRQLPPQPGEAFSTPGSELAAGLPPTIRMETAIKHGDHRMTPDELINELNTAYGEEWVNWEPETMLQMWAQTHPEPPDDELFHKILGLQVLLTNTNGFWNSYPIFRDVVLVLNGVPPVLDGPEDEDSVSPGHLAYGVFIAMQHAPFTAIGQDEPGDEVKQYAAVRFLVNGLVAAMFPLKWAQPSLDALAAQYAQASTGIDKDQIAARLAQVVDLPIEQAGLNENDPVDQQVAQQMAIKHYVTEMEGGL